MVPAAVALPSPCLCLVTDRKLCPKGALTARVAGAVEGGVQIVQLREKDLPRGELLRLAQDIQARIAGNALFIVNERIDVALACGAQGIHLGETALPVRKARRLVGDRMLIGRSVHSVEGAIQAQKEGADYLIVGTVFETASQPEKQPQGVTLLEAVARAVRVPFLAIGGIKASNVARALEAGATGAAVISAILTSPYPKAAAQELLQAITHLPQAQPLG